MAIELFDLDPKHVYGTDTQKNSLTKYNMTVREFLQYFGTDVMRKIKDTIWVDYTIKRIEQEKTSIAIIPDVRFPNEVEAIKKANGIVIRLDRDVYNDDHFCETALDKEKYNWSNFDYIIENNNSSLSDLCKSLEKIKHLWSKL